MIIKLFESWRNDKSLFRFHPHTLARNYASMHVEFSFDIWLSKLGIGLALWTMKSISFLSLFFLHTSLGIVCVLFGCVEIKFVSVKISVTIEIEIVSIRMEIRNLETTIRGRCNVCSVDMSIHTYFMFLSSQFTLEIEQIFHPHENLQFCVILSMFYLLKKWENIFIINVQGFIWYLLSHIFYVCSHFDSIDVEMSFKNLCFFFVSQWLNMRTVNLFCANENTRFISIFNFHMNF